MTRTYFYYLTKIEIIKEFIPIVKFFMSKDFIYVKIFKCAKNYNFKTNIETSINNPVIKSITLHISLLR